MDWSDGAPGSRLTAPRFELVVTASQLGILSAHYCLISGGNNILLYLAGSFVGPLYGIEGNRFTTQGITVYCMRLAYIIRIRASEKFLVTQYCVFNITFGGTCEKFLLTFIRLTSLGEVWGVTLHIRHQSS